MSTAQIMISRPRPVSTMGQGSPQGTPTTTCVALPPPTRSSSKRSLRAKPGTSGPFTASSANTSTSEGGFADFSNFDSPTGSPSTIRPAQVATPPLQPSSQPLQPVTQPLQPVTQPLQPAQLPTQPLQPVTSVIPPMSDTPLQPQPLHTSPTTTSPTTPPPTSTHSEDASSTLSDPGDKYAALADLDMTFNDPTNSPTTTINWGGSDSSEEEDKDIAEWSKATGSEDKDVKVRRYSCQVQMESGGVSRNRGAVNNTATQSLEESKFRRVSTGTVPTGAVSHGVGMQYQPIPYGSTQMAATAQMGTYSNSPTAYSGFSHMAATGGLVYQQCSNPNGTFVLAATSGVMPGFPATQAGPAQQGFSAQQTLMAQQGRAAQAGYVSGWGHFSGVMPQTTAVNPFLCSPSVASSTSLCMS